MKTASITFSVLAAAGIIGSLVLLQSGSGDEPSAPAAEPLPVETIVPERVTSVTRDRHFTGTVTAARRTRLSFERSARLTEVLVDDGDHVEAGQVVARIDQRQLTERLAELKAQRQQQTAVLEELNAGPRKETIAAARAEVAAATADTELKKATLDRTEDLYNRSAASAQRLDEVRLAWKAAAAQTDAAAKRLEELEAGTRSEKIVAQEAVVAGMTAQIEQLTIDVRDSELKAPFAGTVVKRMADEGDFLNPQQPVIVLLESGSLEARIGVPASVVNNVGCDDGYVVLTVADREFTGTVRRIVPMVDVATRTQMVVVALDTAGADDLVDGRLIRMKVADTQPADGFRVPVTALASASRGLWTLYAVESEGEAAAQGILKARSVEVVFVDDDTAVVRGAVADGERIVSDGVHRVVPDQLVSFEAGDDEG